METKIYIQAADKFIDVNNEVYSSFYQSSNAERKRLQKEGKCFCPKNQIWRCDCDCMYCSFYKKPVQIDAFDKYEAFFETGSSESFVNFIVLKQLIKRIADIYPETEKVIWLRYAGYSDREIQKMTGIPRKTFEDHIRSALKQLDVHIEDYL